MQFDHIAVIFNPNSTGSAKRNAEELRDSLAGKLNVAVTLTPTKHAGHAIDLSYDIAKKYKSPLIISASGDGGYNEVINGALRAQAEGAGPTCAVLPSGNANDHARTMHSKPLSDLILESAVTHLDVLKVTVRSGGQSDTRFAHSYVGIGITSVAARELNKTSLSSWRETLITIRAFWNLRPVRIERGGQVREIDSLVCSTIPEMAKMITLSKDAKPDDGMFEVTVLPHNKKLHLAWQMLKGAVHEIGARSRDNDFTFKLLQAAPMQFDGEVMAMQANTDIEVALMPGLLQTIV